MKKRILMYKRRFLLFIVNHFLCGVRQALFPLKRLLLNWAGIKVGKNTRIVGPLLVTCEMIIGDNVWLGRNFSADGNGKVIIGDCCDIAPNVQFYTGSHCIGGHERRAGQGYNSNITIGDGCWLCAASKFLPNVTVGKAVVVAAGSVVTADFKDDLLIGGVPAKEIKNLNIALLDKKEA